MITPKNILQHPVHLGLNATASSEPAMTGMEWFMEYDQRHQEDGKEGRLVSVYTFTEPWKGWERHPAGEELVLCLQGSMTLIQEIDGKNVSTSLKANEYVINPPGIWHTADIDQEATALFITPGKDTDHRPRS